MPRPGNQFFLIACFLPFSLQLPSLWAQMPPTQKDPLIPGQNAQGKAGLLRDGCFFVRGGGGEILPIVMGSSPMEENLRRLTDEIGGRVTGSPEMAKAVEWGVGRFARAGVDVHTEEVHAASDLERRGHAAGVARPGKISRAAESGGVVTATPAGGMETNVRRCGIRQRGRFCKGG